MRTLITRLPLAVLLIPSPIFRTAASRTFAMSTTTNQSSNNPEVAQQTTTTTTTTPQTDADAEQQQQQPKAPLALPAAPADGTTQLDMSNGGTTVSLDHLGPMVVNVDGTMSRISNWDKMAEIEKKNTLRIIGKRNKSRLEALKKERAGAGGEGEEA